MKYFLSFFLFVIFPSIAISQEYLTNEEISYLIVQITGTEKEILDIDSAFKEDLIYFLIEDSGGYITDITKEDPFTGEEKYSYSYVTCELDITFFTSLINKRLYIGSETGETFPQTLTFKLSKNGKKRNYNFYVGGFSTPNMLKTTSEYNEDYLLDVGKTTASTTIWEEYDSREKAKEVLDEKCNIDGVDKIEFNYNKLGDEGILIEGKDERIPFYGNSTLIIMD